MSTSPSQPDQRRRSTTPSGRSATDPSTHLSLLTPDAVDELQRTTGYPLISVLVPTTPGPQLSPDDRATLDALLATVEPRLRLELDEREVDEHTTALRSLASLVADEPARHGLALFVGAGTVRAHQLGHRPIARVVIDPTFATRDLVRDQLDNPPYRLLVLAAGSARLYVGAGRELTEQVQAPFPIRDDAEPPDRRGHLHQAVRTHNNPRRWDRFLRRVDDALGADRTTRSLPLVLAAAEPLGSRFSTRSSQPVIGVVSGNHERTGAHRLVQLARPVVAAHLAGERQRALDELERATGSRRAAFGVHEVWTAARDGRVARLIVDPAYLQPAVTDADQRRITPAPDPSLPDVIDDVVDDIIEMAALHGAPVTFVALTQAQGRIAAVLRTRARSA